MATVPVTVAWLLLLLLFWTSFDSARFLPTLFGCSPLARVSGVDLPRDALALLRLRIELTTPLLGTDGPPPSECPVPENDLNVAALELEAAAA